MNETLESYSIHLLRPMWDRMEVLFDFIKTHQDKWLKPSGFAHHALLDFKRWVVVLHIRGLNHENLNVQRFVHKEVIGRTYSTPVMADFILNEFIKYLSKGHILKDTNLYTPFSRNSDLIVAFLTNYLKNESVFIDTDVRLLFNGLIKHATNQQVIMVVLKTLATDLGDKQAKRFIGEAELNDILSLYDRIKALEMKFGCKYLCQKYCLHILRMYTDKDMFSTSAKVQ